MELYRFALLLFNVKYPSRDYYESIYTSGLNNNLPTPQCVIHLAGFTES